MNNQIFVKQFSVGGDRNFGYLIVDEAANEAVIIDPSYSPQMICDFVKDSGYKVKYIFNTHNHYDHTNGNRAASKLTGITPIMYGDKEPFSGLIVKDNARFPLGKMGIQIIHTPGHTQDSICIYIGDALFTGDTLFVGKVGGTDFGKQAKDEYESLHNKLLILPNSTRVFPGHDYGIAPQSTIENERNTNPFLLRKDFESFVDLKKNWQQYKIEHGID